MVPRENKNNAYAKFGETKKEYYGIFRSGLYNPSEILSPQVNKMFFKVFSCSFRYWRS